LTHFNLNTFSSVQHTYMHAVCINTVAYVLSLAGTKQVTGMNPCTPIPFIWHSSYLRTNLKTLYLRWRWPLMLAEVSV